MRRALLLAALALFAWAPGARAAWFSAEPVDSGAIAFGSLDLARDGTGAVVYVKPDGIYLSRLRDGTWQAPERVAGGPASDPVVAVADEGALVVAWRSLGRVLAASSDGEGLSAPVDIGSGDPGPPDADMAVQRTAYVTFANGGDVFAVRLREGVWQAVGAPLDVDPAQVAGAGAGRPRVAVAADGNGVVTWAEAHPDGRRRVYGRRVIELRVSALPQEISLPEFNGVPGGHADSPDIDIEDDVSFAWVTFRQDFGGVSRTLGRRLVGSLFEAPAIVDLGSSGREPRVDMTGRGDGFAVTQSDAGEIAVSTLWRDVFEPARILGSGAAPLVATSENRDMAAAWQSNGFVVARHAEREAEPAPEAPLGAGSGPAAMAADRAGDFAVGWLQEDRVVVSVWDQPPRAASLRTNRAWKPIARPLFRWGVGEDLWGPQRFEVLLEGEEIGATTAEQLVSPRKLRDGRHRWQLVSVDRRGQKTRSKNRYVRVDTRPPAVRVRRSGLSVRVGVTDAGAGVQEARVAFGDGARTVTTGSVVHRYGRSGTFRVVVRATDEAGNRGRRSVRVRVG